MNRFRSRSALAALAAGGALGATLLVGPVASADPTTDLVAPLLESDCTFAQVDAALHTEAPQLAAVLDANPSQKAQLQAAFDQPVEQRRAQLQQAIQENPEAAAQAANDPRTAEVAAAIRQVAATCANY